MYQPPPGQPPWQQQPPTQYPPHNPQPGNFQQQYTPPPPYYQPPVMPPPMMVRPPPPKRPNGCLIAIAVFVMIGVLGMIVSAVGGEPRGTSTTANTAQPTDTPTPAPLTDMSAIDSQVQDDINNANLQGDDIRSGYGKYHNAFAIIGLQPPITMSKSEQLALIQSDCFDGQKAIWTDPLLQNIGRMEVFIFTLDTKGLPVTVGDCILHPKHAHKINWDTTDAVTAWNNKVYENMTP